MGSSKRRPIRRLMAKMVFSGLVTAWRFAAWPTRTSPSLPNATMEGVVRAPSAFSITLACLPSITATQELVVPRSIPITLVAISASAFGRFTALEQVKPCGNVRKVIQHRATDGGLDDRQPERNCTNCIVAEI